MNGKKNEKKPTNSSCPYDKATLLSKYVTFFWVSPLLWLGMKRNIGIDDLSANPREDSSQLLGNQLELAWKSEVIKAARNNREPSLMRVFIRQHSFWFCLSWLWIFISHCIISPLQAMSLGRLIQESTRYYDMKFALVAYSQEELDKKYWEIFYQGLLVIITTGIVFVTIHPYFFCVQHLGMKLRIASCNLVYRKALRLSKTSLGQTTVGQIVNLLSNDVNRFDFGIVFIPYLIIAPLQAIVIIVLLSHYYLGWIPTLAGFSLFLLYLPFQGLMGKWFGTIREETAIRTDERIRLMNEIIPAMRMIKMYAWEKPFEKLVDEARREEVKFIRRRVMLTSLNESLYFISAKLIIMIVILTLVYIGEPLTAEAAFVTITLLDSLRLNMTFFFPFAIESIAEMIVSCERIRNYLIKGERGNDPRIKSISRSSNKDKQQLTTQTKAEKNEDGKEDEDEDEDEDGKEKEKEKEEGDKGESNDGIVARKISAAWIDDSFEQTDETSIALSNIDFSVQLGELLVIVGRVGAGKSSILMSILGELPIVGGELLICGRLSYASQEPWIFAGTLEDNVLFGSEFDEKRFAEVLRVCALDKDVELLPNGKETLVGERGISLSGGQKARVNLARALYFDADIYLLDDPLSAVDSLVAKHIFEHCIRGFLKQKAVILVTHQFQFVKEANKILVIDQGVQIALGNHSELSKKVDLVGFGRGMYRSESESEQASFVLKPGSSPNKKPVFKNAIDTPSTKHSGNQIVPSIVGVDEIQSETPIRQTSEEVLGDESVGLKAYAFLLTSVSSISLLILVFFANIFAQIIFNGSDFYLSFWTETEERRGDIASTLTSNLNATTTTTTNSTTTTNTNILTLKPLITDRFTTYENSYIYVTIIIALFFSILLRTTTFFVACMRASIKMHDRLFKSVMSAPISFFDFNPIGILLNRISRDMGIVDDRLPQNAFDVFEISTSSFGIIATVIIVDLMNLIPAIMLIVVALLARRACLQTIKRLKEMEGILRSQVFSHLSTTLAGLTTIRSFKVNERFIDTFDVAQDEHSIAWFTFFSSGQLLGLTLDIICLIFILFVIIVLTTTISTSAYTGSQVGLAISSALVIVGPFQWGIRQLVELESHMVSVKRIQEYSELPREEPENKQNLLQQPPSEWPDKGSIEYENVSLNYFEDEAPVLRNLSFKIEAREKVGIVGRTGAGKSSIVAALFRMTEPDGKIIIDNIDTKSMKLEQLRRKISIIPQDPILFSGSVRRNLDPFDEHDDRSLWAALDSVQLKRAVLDMDGGLRALVSEGGQNFSVGQRQLVCLARAILRKNKILVLDEATANVDPETDQFIQRTIRDLFKNCTVVTIAHRLNTIMDSDRVLVLEAGQLCEFDEPHLLLTRGGTLATMVANTGQQAERLRRIAERAYNRRHRINTAV